MRLSRVAEIKSQRKISEACPLYLIKEFTESILQRAKFVLDVLGTNMNQQESAAICVMYYILKKRRNKKIKCWVKKMDTASTFVHELKIEDAQQYVNCLIMSASQVETIIQFTGDIISKKDTKMQQAITRVVVTL